MNKVDSTSNTGATNRTLMDQIAVLEAELNDQETRIEWLRQMEAAVHTSLYAVALCDMDGMVTFSNQACLDLWGFDSHDEVLGRPAGSFWSDPDTAETLLQFVRDTGSWLGELVGMRKNGSTFTAQLFASLFYDSQGAPSGMMTSFVDLSAHKQIENELRFFALAVENAADAIGMSTPDGRHYYQNQAFDDLFGFVGDNPPSTLYADHVVGRKVFDTIRAGGSWTGEVEMCGRNNALLTILLRAYAIKTPAGEIIGLVGIHTDITAEKQGEKERSQLHAQLMQAQKLESVGRLAGGVAHDFNNMLMVIIGSTDMALEKADPSDPIHIDLMEIRNAALRSADISRQLLAFARKQPRAPVVLNMNDAISGMMTMLERLIGEDVAVVWKPETPVWPVFIDPAQLHQILVNLCVNARDAITGVGNIIVETGTATLDETYCTNHLETAPGAFTTLSVSDTGCGMSAETLASIFEPFFTTKGPEKGTGLGMAMVYGIVKQNSGTINVYSEPDKGTTVKIYLPRCDAKSEALPKPATLPDIPRGNGEMLLLVEDDPAILRICGKLLRRLGYRVMTADRPHKAIALAREHPDDIALLVTDMVMPEMNGKELAREITGLYPHIKTIFMSGYTANSIVHHGILEEGIHFIQKPFSLPELATKLFAVLTDT